LAGHICNQQAATNKRAEGRMKMLYFLAGVLIAIIFDRGE
jgi:hypothetical protein